MDKDRHWVIWSNEHIAFWKPNHGGYCYKVENAGRYSFEKAREICKSGNYPSDETGYPIGRLADRKIVINEVMCPSPEYVEEMLLDNIKGMKS